MSKTRLRRLQVDAIEHERGRVRPPEVVERQTAETGETRRREPHAAAPVRVIERTARGCREQERGTVSRRQLRVATSTRSISSSGSGIANVRRPA